MDFRATSGRLAVWFSAEPDSDSESKKGNAEAASASKSDVPVIDVDFSDEQSLDEIPDALAWLNIKIEPPAEEAAAEKASAEEGPAEKAPGKAPAEGAEAMNADTEDVANEPQRKRIRRKRSPQPVPVSKVRPMNILDVAPSKESAPGVPIRMLLRLLQRRPEMFRLRLLLQR